MHRLGVKNMHKVWDDDQHGNSLYLGDYYAASNYTKLKESKISALLTAAAGLNITHEDKTINHKVYNAWDMPSYNISRHFSDAFEFIDNQLKKGNILVHCAAGISRSATLVIMYLMKKNGWDLKKTVGYVRNKRPIICPNYGFMKHLENFEKGLSLDMRKSRIPEIKTSEMKGAESKKEMTGTVSNFDKTSSGLSRNGEQKQEKGGKSSKVFEGASLAKSYYKNESLKKPSIRPFSVQKGADSSATKRPSIPAWKRFLQSTQPVAPRIVTIKP